MFSEYKQTSPVNRQLTNDVERLPQVIADANSMSLDTQYDVRNIEFLNGNHGVGHCSYINANADGDCHGSTAIIRPYNGIRQPENMITNGVEQHFPINVDVRHKTESLPRYNVTCYEKSATASYLTPPELLQMPILDRSVHSASSTSTCHHSNSSGEDARHSRNTSQENQRHSRNTSNENQRHSRNSSNENNRHSRHSSNDNNRHSRNSSNENIRHSRNTSDEHERNIHSTRVQSEENIRYSPHMAGIMHRSSSHDGPPIFTVESFARSTDAFNSEKDLQMYYQELIRQRTPISNDHINKSGKVATSFLNENVFNGAPPTQNLLHDNVRR